MKAVLEFLCFWNTTVSKEMVDKEVKKLLKNK